MNHLLRTCKCHWVGEEYVHWGRAALDRRAFAAPGTAPKFAPDAPVAGRHFKLELHLDPEAERAWGTTTHEIDVRAAEVREVRFNAARLEIGAARVGGKATGFENTGEEVIVHLPRPLKRGASATIALDHSVTRPAAGLYFTNPDPAYPDRFRTVWSQGQDEDSRHYFPCLDKPNFKQSSEALLWVPRGWFALSNGELVRQETRAAGRGRNAAEELWHYRMELPYSTYLFSVVAGEFSRHSEVVGGVDVRRFVQKGREGEGANAFGNTGEILRFLAEVAGHPYPFKQYTQIAVPDFVFGGMENFTVTTQTDLTLHDDRAHLDFSSDDLVAHEAAHTWFGDLVTCRSWAHAWLHESFATYMEALWAERRLGIEERDYQLLRDAEAYFTEDAVYRRPLVTHRYEAPIDLFDAHLYPGGAVRLRHLHAVLGDAPFRAALTHYLERHRLGLAETVDLARAVEAVTGLSFDWWFHQWIHSGGYPAFEVRYTWKAEDNLAEVVVKQTQPLDEGQGGSAAGSAGAAGTAAPGKAERAWFRVPTRLLFQAGEKRVELPVTVEGEECRFLVPLEKKPTMILFDPRFECPAKSVKFEKGQDLLLQQLRHAEGVVARIEAADALAEKPGHAVVLALRERLRREPFWGVQQRIAKALGKIGGKAARDALIAGLAVEHPKARRAVVEALGTFKDDPQAARALERLARAGDASYYVEGELARALGRCRAPKALELLRGYLEQPSHVEVIRSGAYDGLAELADPETLPLIEAGLRYGAPALARPAAIRAAAELGRRHRHLRPRVIELLGPVAEHKDQPSATFRGKMAALRAFEKLGELDATPILRRVAAGEVDGRIVRLARQTIEALRRQASKPAELGALRTDVDQITKENKALRDRLEVLERKPKSAAPKKGRRKPAG